ncbi:MAG: ThiF family adenylyltransferase [Planctomycetes bacterium]|nr:ThiF family adenylyltransferase [Planctomycetota bacterium]
MNDRERYQRQEHSFPHERRTQTFIAEVGGEHAGWTSAFLKAGAAAAGTATLWSDYHGYGEPGGHWLQGGHDGMVGVVNADVDYDFIDPGMLREDLEQVIARHRNSWVVAHVNDPAGAVTALEQLSGLPVRVLLPLAAAGGVVVQRHPDPDTALERLGALGPMRPIPAGSAELAVVAAGAALNEIILGGTSAGDDLDAPRIALFYSLDRRRRIDVPGEAALEEILAEFSADRRRATFSGRRIKQVGAGALGNWTAIGVALDGDVAMEVIDGDATIERHNLNRQILLVGGVGRPKAPVLTGQLAALDPAGTYTHVSRFVERAADLEPLDGVDAVIMAPDNDDARLVGADAAWRHAIPYAVGGTGATGGQLIVQEPHRACFRCVTGLGDKVASKRDPAGGNSCARTNQESIVASNMIVAGLLVSELRETLAGPGRRSQNLRLFGDSAGTGNRLGRMTSDPECSHLADVGSEAGAPVGA